MWQKIKAWPTTVQAAVVFLITIWVALIIAAPPVFITLTVVALIFASIVHICIYFMKDL